MSVTLLFLAVAGAIVVWWVLMQRLKAKPWTEHGALEDFDVDRGSAAKIGLGFFLAVVTSLFSLFISAYFTRMSVPDWTPLTEPALLWFNTALLVAASIAFQWARRVSEGERIDRVRTGLAAAGVFSLMFIAGQLWAWKELVEAGYFLQSNPANAFFYLFTGLHAIHLLGGLWVWGRTTARVWGGVPKGAIQDVRMSVQLCSLYWHFLLLVWFVLFWLFLST